MLKAILFAPFIVGLLGGIAHADTSSYQVELLLAQTRYTIFVVDNNCGEVVTKSPDRERRFRVCAQPSDKRIRLEIERRTRDKADEVHATSTVLATPGTAYDLDGLKVSVKVL